MEIDDNFTVYTIKVNFSVLGCFFKINSIKYG